MVDRWYQNAVFYGVDIRRFQDTNGDGFGDIPGLIHRLDYLKDLGIDALWLNPFLDTPFQDNGYDTRDYYRIDPRVGTLDDFKNLVDEVHKRHMHIIMDLVMNHTSNEHAWFQASRISPDSRFRDYYIWSDKIPEKTLGGSPIFPGEENDVWTYDPEARAYYYHRFYHFQPGLRVANPRVQEEMFNIIDFWLSMGVDGFRFDALPIMLEVKGVPETQMEHSHRLVETFHDFIIHRKREAVLLGEANVSLDVMDKFFGGGSEMNMLFNFLIGPHIMLAFAHQDAHALIDYIKDALDPPAQDQWLNFLRHHDEMTLSMMPDEQKETIFREFSPEERMRIYGRGIRRRLAPMLSDGHNHFNRPQFEMAFSFLFTTPGTPLIYYGDEIGMGDDLSLPGRNAVRTPMQWNDEKNGGFSTADHLIAPVVDEGIFSYEKVNVARQLRSDDSLLHWFKQLIAVRKEFPEIGLCPGHLLPTKEEHQRVIAHAFPRIPDRHESTPLVLIHNPTPNPHTATVDLPPDESRMSEMQVKFGRGQLVSSSKEQIQVELPAYGYLWIQI